MSDKHDFLHTLMRGNIMKRKTIKYDVEMVKLMIEMAYSFEEADDIIKEYKESDDPKEKLGFLQANFRINLIGSGVAEVDKDSESLIMYEAVLKTIISRKWR